MQQPRQDETARKAWMALLAKAPAERLTELWNGAGLDAEHTVLRAPETGAVMVRGRAGGTGSPFNLGEMTVTRCSIALTGGAVGHGYVPGRNRRHAEIAALCDALMQTDRAGAVEVAILAPLREEAATRRAALARKAAATKVEFFTMVRGDN
ncbi:MAG: phosphonate C-P lyase system protein PhnG [Rubricella sp.]